MSAAKFYVELPADEYGNTAMQKAVVQAELSQRHGRDWLTPLAPQYHTDHSPDGWYRDVFGGWAEVDGPARMLTNPEYDALVGSLSEKSLASAKSGLVLLRTGEKLPRSVVQLMVDKLQSLLRDDLVAFCEVVSIARDQRHVPFGTTGDTLRRHSFIEPSGRMHDLTRSVILAATEGDLLELKLVNPVKSVV